MSKIYDTEKEVIFELKDDGPEFRRRSEEGYLTPS